MSEKRTIQATCFTGDIAVLAGADFDYLHGLQDVVAQLMADVARYENGRLVMVNEIARLKAIANSSPAACLCDESLALLRRMRDEYIENGKVSGRLQGEGGDLIERLSRRSAPPVESGCLHCDAPTHGTADCIWKGLQRCVGGVRHTCRVAASAGLHERVDDRCDRCGQDPRELARAAHTPSDVIPDKVFDGYSVWTELQNDPKARTRTSHENVQDVLNAIVRFKRTAPPPRALPLDSNVQTAPLPPITFGLLDRFEGMKLLELGDQDELRWSQAAIDFAALVRTDAPPPSAWQPIETAPKDGKLFFVAEGLSLGLRYWASGELQKFVDIFFIGGSPENPTHWQPLPAPPTSASTKADVPRRCRCGRFEFGPNDVKIESSDGSMHYTRFECTTLGKEA